MNMDKNTVVGLVLIAALLIGFSYFSRPNEEQIAAAKQYNDSISLIQKQGEELKTKAEAALINEKVQSRLDSTSLFFRAAQGNEEFTSIENDVVKLTFTNKGGRIYSAMLKKYDGQDMTPLVIFDKDEAFMNF
ncbi:Membrane protein insertase YidC, partial [termite gut metagenome]